MYVRPLVDADLNKLSVGEQEALSNAIEKYASLSYDEIKKEEKHSLSRTMWPGARQPAILTVLIGIAFLRPVGSKRHPSGCRAADREAGLDGEELVASLCTAHQGQAGVVHGG